jgi:hypothetical protein
VVFFATGRETPPSETHHGEDGTMRQYLPRTGSPHAALLEIPCLLIKDPTMCRTITIELPPYFMEEVNFISLFDVDAFCLVGKRSGHQSLTLEDPRSLLVS